MSILQKVDQTKIQRFSNSGIRSIVPIGNNSQSAGAFSQNEAIQHLMEFAYILFVIYSAYMGKTMTSLAFVCVTIFILPGFVNTYIIPILQMMKIANSTINAYIVPGLILFGVGFICAIGIFMVLLKLCVSKKISCGYIQLGFASAFYAGFSFVACLIVFLCFRYIPALEIIFTNMLPNFLKPYSLSVRYVMASFFGTITGIGLSRNAFLSGVAENKFSKERLNKLTKIDILDDEDENKEKAKKKK